MKLIRENLFGGFNNFAALFDTKAKVNKVTNKEEEKLMQQTDIVSLEDNGIDTILQMGGNASYSDHSASTDMSTQRDHINEYRSMARQPEVEEAIDHIINDMITTDDIEEPVVVNLDKVEINDALKDKIREEFKTILGMMDFYDRGYDRVKSFYIDGRAAAHLVVNEKNKRQGIRKIVMLDSRAVRRMRKIHKERGQNGIDSITKVEDFFIYDPNVIRKLGGASRNFEVQQQALKIPLDVLAYVDSGETELEDGFVPGMLHSAMRPLNNLISLEDATVIYAITRAPEKRAFYLDVGSLPKKSAEEYMKMMMGMFKTKVTYDRETGKVDSGAQHMGIVQDYWMPRREGANATEIQTIEGGSALQSMMEPVQYHLEKVYRALKVPKGRISEGGGVVNIGGSDLAETSREEHRFGKYVNRLQRRYGNLFKDILRTQLILKNITTEQDWMNIFENNIKFDFTADNYIKELQENELLTNRFQTLQTVEPYVGKLMSVETAQRDILRWDDEKIALEKERIQKEDDEGIYTDIVEVEDGEGGKVEQEQRVSPLKFKETEGGGF